MKKFLRAAVLAALTLLFNFTAVSAENIWAYQQDYKGNSWDCYIETDSIRAGNYYYVTVRLLKNDRFSHDRYYRFDYSGDKLVYEYKDNIKADYTHLNTVKYSWTAATIWNKMKPYMDAKGISYGAAWGT